MLQKYNNVGFLLPIVNAMTQHDPAERPDAAEALRQWRLARRSLPFVQRRWRLRLREEPLLLGLGGDSFYLMTLAAHWLTGSKYTNNVFQL